MQQEAIELEKSWYAAKVFYNKTAELTRLCEEMSVKTYIPSSVITSLAFVYCTDVEIRQIQNALVSKLSVYTYVGNRNPIPISNKEMELFIFVTSADDNNLLFLGDDCPEYHQGDRVRVTEGPFKGAEGHVKRIKKDRRLIISIPGVVAVATAFIPPQFLEKVEPTS